MLREAERAVIEKLWQRKLEQDAKGLPQWERHRNLEPASAEFICALAAGVGAKRMLEIGGSTGISTIALAAAARDTGGKLISMEIDPARQTESRQTLGGLGLEPVVDYRLGDAAALLPDLGEVDFVLIDCEKEDYIRFFDMLKLPRGGIVVADNILSHDLKDYVAHVRKHPGVESVTLSVGKGLEVTRFA